MKDDYEDLELSYEDQEDAESLANAIIELMVSHSAKMDVAWEAIDILTDTIQELEETELQNDTHGINGVEYLH